MINRKEEMPDLPDRLSADIHAAHEDEQQRKEDNLRWLEEHSDFRPFGYEW